MATKVIMPQLGESVVEGTVSKWLVSVGDTVDEFDPLLEVSTDKVDTEVPSPAKGTILKILVSEDETVEAGVLLAVIGEPDEEVGDMDGGAVSGNGHTQSESAQVPEKQASKATVTTPAGNGRSESRGARISPVVARMLAEHDLDIKQIEGTGREGRVTKKDVLRFLETGVAEPELAPWEQPGSGDLFKPTGDFVDTSKKPAPASKPATTSARAIPAEPVPEGVPGELVELNRMRRSIAEHMVQSKLHTSPHVTTVMEVDMTNVLAHRASHKEQFAKNGVNLTLTAYLVAAMVDACQQVPLLNSQWTDEGIYLHHHVHVGMAVAIDDGLIVPVIHNADEMNLMGLARKVNDLAIRARNNKLAPDEITGSTITLTNHGVSGSLFATPIINQPNAAIMGVGVMEKRVKVINDAIAIRHCMYITLTFDHRIADGASGDAWLMAVKQRLDNWS
jgi:2-oxoglutarate dehydrogenase E2 component (dihydrolipoamide succinyltransferase)